MLTRLRLRLSHLRYHNLGHNFQDYINPICVCGLEIKATTHSLLHWPLLQSARQSLLINIKKIHKSILKKHGELITKNFCMAIANLTCLVINLQQLQQLNSLFLLKDLEFNLV